MKSAIFACLAASIISCIGTSLELSPYAIFSLIEQSNKIGSCETIPTYYYYDFKMKFQFKITIKFSIMIFPICAIVPLQLLIITVFVLTLHNV